MNVSIETLTGLERRLTIALQSENFESQITQRLQDARTKVRIPGFRPGKVPMKEVRRRYGQAIRAEVAGELMQSSFVSAIQQEDLNPAGSPSLDVLKMDPGIDFEFTATFEVFPNVVIGDLGQLQVRQAQAEITEDDMKIMVDKLVEQRTVFELVERPAAAGDQVKADFSATLEGEAVEGTEGTDSEFRLGSGQMIEDFDQGVQGASAGETVQFDATFPDDYRAEDLQGKTVQFSVSVKEVKQAVVPELNDEFFKEFGVEDGGQEAFMTDVRENMARELESAVNNQVKQQVMDKLGDLHEFHLPKAVVQREIDALKEQMLGQFQMTGPGPKPDLPNELFQEQAEKRVKVGLVVNEVIRSESLVVDQAMLDARLEDIASQYGEPEQVISWYRSNPDQLQNIEMGVLEEQVVQHIMTQSQVEVVECSYADAISGKAVEVKEEPSADNTATET
ncbi:MAG: trigger factor [Pseudomonadales bacterium]|jgi:trigger factor|nr:trigger factor [Pseudomonadales bacterium]